MKWFLISLGLGFLALFILWTNMPPLDGNVSPKRTLDHYQRVVSLAPSMTETMLALNQKHRLVGITIQCQKKDLEHISTIGSFAEPNFEAIMALKPDLILGVPHVMALPIINRIKEQGIEVFAHQPDSLADIKLVTEKLAEIFSVSEQGIIINQKIDQAIESAKLKLSNSGWQDKRRVLFAVSITPFVVSGYKTFPSEVIEILGFYNSAHANGIPWPVWPLEKLLSDPPHILILESEAHSASAHRIVSTLGLSSRNMRIITPNRPIFNSPSPAIIEDIAYLTILLSSNI